jgi:hypothetical protein
MPKWLQGMVTPTLLLWLYAVALGIAFAATLDEGLPKQADYASSAALALILATWVTADARKRRRPLCYDYDTLVFFAWPIVIPVYLFQTRGLRAFLTLLCFAGICFVAVLCAAAVVIIREFAFA